MNKGEFDELNDADGGHNLERIEFADKKEREKRIKQFKTDIEQFFKNTLSTLQQTESITYKINPFTVEQINQTIEYYKKSFKDILKEQLGEININYTFTQLSYESLEYALQLLSNFNFCSIYIVTRGHNWCYAVEKSDKQKLSEIKSRKDFFSLNENSIFPILKNNFSLVKLSINYVVDLKFYTQSELQKEKNRTYYARHFDNNHIFSFNNKIQGVLNANRQLALLAELGEQQIELHNLLLDKTRLPHFLEALAGKPIRKLTISACVFEPGACYSGQPEAKTAMQLLADIIKATPNLEELEITNCSFEDDTKLQDENIQPVLEALQDHPGLQRLDLSDNELSDASCEILQRFLQQSNGHLHVLRLNNNKISDNSVTALATALGGNKEGAIKPNNSLYELSLDGNNGITTAIINQLGEALTQNKVLTTLQLNCSHINKAAIDSLLKLIACKALKNLDNVDLSKPRLNIVNTQIRTLTFNKDKKGSSAKDHLTTYTQTINGALYQNLVKNIKEGKLKEVKDALTKVSLYALDDKGNTLLHLAVQNSQLEIVKLLLSQGIDKNIRNSTEQTALDLAEQQKQELINKQEPTTQIDEIIDEFSKDYSQQIAAATAKQDTPKTKQGSTKTAGKKRQREQPAKAAATAADDAAVAAASPVEDTGSEEPQSKKPRRESTVETQSEIAASALSALLTLSADSIFDLIADGAVNRVKRLINSNKTYATTAQDDQGRTALHVAAEMGQLDIAKALLAAGADPNAQDDDGASPLHVIASSLTHKQEDAIINASRLDIAYLLVRRGADVTLQAQEQNITALHKAIAQRQYRLAKILLNTAKCNPLQKDRDGYTALHWAIHRQDIQMVARLLIDRRIAKDNIAECLTFFSNSDTSEEIIKLLEQAEKREQLAAERGLQWVKQFSVVYGSSYYKPTKTTTVTSDKQHAYLASQNSLTQHFLANSKLITAVIEKGKKNEAESVITDIMNDDELENLVEGNPVTASLTFILSPPTFLAGAPSVNQKVRIALDFSEFHHIANYLKTRYEMDDVKIRQNELAGIQQRANASGVFTEQTAGLSERLQKAIDGNQVARPENIQLPMAEEDGDTIDLDDAEQEAEDKNYYQALRHGEQALLHYLEQASEVQKIVQQLLNNSKVVPGSKIKGVLLDIHSPRYLCQNCEVAILGSQNSEQSIFLSRLQAELEATKRLRLPRYSPLRMVTQVSSYIPFSVYNKDVDKHQAQAQEGASQYLFDMRDCRNEVILARDLSVKQEEALTQFLSRQPK